MNIQKILIGIDDSKYAENAAEFGFNMARKFDAAVGLVHIVEPLTVPPAMEDTLMGVNFTDTVGYDTTELLNVQAEQSEGIIAETIKKFGDGLAVSHFTEFGSTAEGIIACSKAFKADMIVVGTHSRTGFDRLMMGSVAEHVVRYATVPVLVVPFIEE